jgi:hypothetical protein
LELAGNAARDNKKVRITPRHLQLAIRGDDEFAKLLSHVTISEGGVMVRTKGGLRDTSFSAEHSPGVDEGQVEEEEEVSGASSGSGERGLRLVVLSL